MTNAGNDRQEIRQVAKEQEPDWQCLPDGAKDLFHRGMHDVEVHYDASDTATLALRRRERTQIPPDGARCRQGQARCHRLADKHAGRPGLIRPGE